MAERILVVDYGETIIGIQNANGGKYIPYFDEKRIRALERLEQADEVVTYNGNRYDIGKLNNLSIMLRGREFLIAGIHTDMRELCWPGIIGSSLESTFNKYYDQSRVFPDTYEGSNQKDVYMTLMLWRYWKKLGRFK
ncbi:hypothetical protein MN202_05130 [Rheinheimera muenzenbergensis]|uniref:Uncharacterized protein n=1 Tax=Rheinheimera muenzenbergensis TaxID=1193628 RepID=A0ABU8C3V8_9GAMM